MSNFRHCVTESTLTYSLSVWFASCTEAEQQALKRVINTGGERKKKITRTSLPPDPHQPAPPPARRHSQSIIQDRSHVWALCTPHNSTLNECLRFSLQFPAPTVYFYPRWFAVMTCVRAGAARFHHLVRAAFDCTRHAGGDARRRRRFLTTVANKVLEPERLDLHRLHVTSSTFFFYHSLRC